MQLKFIDNRRGPNCAQSECMNLIVSQLLSFTILTITFIWRNNIHDISPLILTRDVTYYYSKLTFFRQ